MVYCKFCGKLNPDDARFCSSCGKELQEEHIRAEANRKPTVEIQAEVGGEAKTTRKYDYVAKEIAFVKYNIDTPSFLSQLAGIIVFLLGFIAGVSSESYVGVLLFALIGMFIGGFLFAAGSNEGGVVIGTTGGSVDGFSGGDEELKQVITQILSGNSSIIQVKREGQYQHLINVDRVTKVAREVEGNDILGLIGAISLLVGVILLFIRWDIGLAMIIGGIIAIKGYGLTQREGMWIETVGGHNMFFYMQKEDADNVIDRVKKYL